MLPLLSLKLNKSSGGKDLFLLMMGGIIELVFLSVGGDKKSVVLGG